MSYMYSLIQWDSMKILALSLTIENEKRNTTATSRHCRIILWPLLHAVFFITGVRKKSAFVTKAIRNVQFFWVIISLFPEYEFKRFLRKHVVKQSFPRLKEQHLIGKPLFSPGFCWKFDLGKLFTLIYLTIFNEKAKNHAPQCQPD